MKYWFIESARGWFVVASRKKNNARRAGVEEYGRGNATIRLATDDEVTLYKSTHGEIEEL